MGRRQTEHDPVVKVIFYAGPEDGSEREMPTPLSNTLDICGAINDIKDEQGETIGQWQKVYHYHLAMMRRRMTYCYQGESLEEIREEVDST